MQIFLIKRSEEMPSSCSLLLTNFYMPLVFLMRFYRDVLPKSFWTLGCRGIHLLQSTANREDWPTCVLVCGYWYTDCFCQNLCRSLWPTSECVTDIVDFAHAASHKFCTLFLFVCLFQISTFKTKIFFFFTSQAAFFGGVKITGVLCGTTSSF